ncbi:MAG: trypsin-like peptidase domain-containing protein [Magnetococcales bacterium]|nr:trypsin-like peptidase domain-containing protein [Magnetococcales bacterium]
MISKSDVFCGKVYHKYLYLTGLIAVLVMIGSYWFVEHYSKRNPTPVSVSQPGGSGTPGVMAQQNQPLMNLAQPVAAQMPQQQAPTAVRTFAEVVRSIMPSVVNVSATMAATSLPAIQGPPDPNGQTGMTFARPQSGISQESIGSGVIVTAEGHILTNFHVIESAKHVSVTVFNDLGTKHYFADIIGRDERRDLALLKITPQRNLPPAALGSSDAMQVGDSVIAIGSPFGLDQTVSKGIISGKNKMVNIGGTLHRGLLQTDAAINRGNSGGPLVDQSGRIIGINTAIYTTTSAFSGVGFAIPMKMAKEFMEELIRLPKVDPMRVNQALPGMAVVAGGGGAPPIMANAIMPHGDRGPCESCHEILPTTQPIAAVNNGAPPILADAIMPHGDRGPCEACHQILPAPQTVALGMGDQGQSPGLFSPYSTAPLGAFGLPVAASIPVENSGVGATLQTVDPTQNNLPVPGGVQVLAIQPGLAFDLAGFQINDVLFKLDGRRVVSVEAFNQFLAGQEPGNTVRASIVRDGDRQDLVLLIDRPGAVSVARQQPQARFAGPGEGMPGPTQRAGAGGRAQTNKKTPPGLPAALRTEFDWMGMELTPTPAPKRANQQRGQNRGAMVGDIKAGTSAQKAGLKPGDLIVAINGQPVPTAVELDAAIKSVNGQSGVLLELKRGGERLFTVLQ